MLFGLDQKKIAVILFFTTVTFLIANIIADKITGTRVDVVPQELSGEDINSKFISAVRVFGVSPDWITAKKHSKKDPASLYASYSIDVPPDLPIALLIREVTNTYDTNNVKLVINEKKIKGITSLKLLSGGKQKIAAEFNYKAGLNRKAGSIGFLLEDFKDLDDTEDSVLLNSPESFAVILMPSKQDRDLAKKITGAGKEYVIFLNDDISELIYRLNPNYSETRLKGSIRSILGDFGSSVFLIIDDNSSLFSSPAYTVLKHEMEKRNIKLLRKNSFRALNPDNLRAYLRGINDGELKTVVMSAGDYIKINNTLMSFRKVGYKFINPSLSVQ
jgi:hypothetical protein